jgi:hypothetical protein
MNRAAWWILGAAAMMSPGMVYVLLTGGLPQL